jgi:hypothetical protein
LSVTFFVEPVEPSSDLSFTSALFKNGTIVANRILKKLVSNHL